MSDTRMLDRFQHGLYTWKKMPRLGQKVVTDYGPSDGFPTRIVALREDTGFSGGAAAKVLLPDDKRSSWVSIEWLVPYKASR